MERGMSDEAREAAAVGRAVERLRGFRVRAEGDDGLAPVLAAMQKEFRRQERRQAGVAEAWEALVPADLRARAGVVGVESGTLRVCVDDSATAYRLDQWLRGGGERALIQRAAASVRRVRVRVSGGR